MKFFRSKYSNFRFISSVADLLQTKFNLSIERIITEERIEEKLLSNKHILAENNISCRRITKENNIEIFFVENNFIRKLIKTKIKILKSSENLKQGNRKQFVNLTSLMRLIQT